MITAQKARNLQMLQIGDRHSAAELKIIDACLEGKNQVFVVTFPDGKRQELRERGFTVQYDNRISEYKITW